MNGSLQVIYIGKLYPQTKILILALYLELKVETESLIKILFGWMESLVWGETLL